MIVKYKIFTRYLLILVLLLGILFLIFKNTIINKQIEGMSNQFTAVIVEPREHKALEYVLENFAKNLDKNWSILIMHGKTNERYVKDILHKKLGKYKGRISLYNMQVENLSIEDYNDLLTSHKFYQRIPTETFLIFQTDSIICEECSDYINEFLEYDYVGAPNKEWVGNGGLSLRKKSKMIEVLNKNKRMPGENEDIFFTKKENNLYIPDLKTANRFSNEGNYSPNSFGVHKPWWYFNEDELYKKQTHCRTLTKLIELNKN